MEFAEEQWEPMSTQKLVRECLDHENQNLEAFQMLINKWMVF